MADPEQELVEQSVRETEDDLLKSAFEPKEKEPEAQAPEPEAKGPARDPETGRFTAKPEVAAAEDKPAAEEQPPDKAEAEKPEEQVPSWRLREINEEKRQAQAELERMRAEHARMQAYMAQIQRQQAPAAEPPPPDPMIDPAAYTKHVQEGLRREFEQRAFNDRLNHNLEIAHLRHGERFERAYEAVITAAQRGDNQLVRHFVSQPNPGEAMVRWYTQSEVLREVGNDPSAYKQKTREELLKNPEFLAQAVEAHRRLATGGGQPQNTVVKLPPSLSKATGTTEVPQSHTDGSESGIFAYAMQPKRR
jgi:hypothetical protein